MKQEPKKILIRGPSWVGDIVMATPLMAAIRRRYPEADIRLALKPYAIKLLDGSTLVDSCLPVEGGSLAASWRWGRSLRQQGFDLVVLLPNSWRSALEAFAAGIPCRVGYRRDGRSILLHKTLSPPKNASGYDPQPMATFYLELARLIDCASDDFRYQLNVTPAQEAAATSWFERFGIDPKRPILGINPGASFGASKLWLPERFAALTDKLVASSGLQAILLGGPGEENLLNSIAGQMNERVANSAKEIIPLDVLKAVVQKLSLMITTDTGPRAIAQAFKIPSVVLMGSTHPGWTAINNEQATILRYDVPCGPCHLKVCPTDHVCMTKISVDEAFRAAQAQLMG